MKSSLKSTGIAKPTPLIQLRSSIPDQFLLTFDSIICVFEIQSNCIGLITTISQIRLDLMIAASQGLDFEKWTNEIESIRLILLDLGVNQSEDLAQIENSRLTRIEVLTTSFKEGVSTDIKNIIQSIRALIILKSVSTRKIISIEFARNFIRLLKSTQGELARLGDSLSLNPVKLRELRESFNPTSHPAYFLTEVIKALNFKLPDPVNHHVSAVSIIKLPIIYQDGSLGNQKETNKDQTTIDEFKEEVNLIEIHLRQSRFSVPRENCGVEYNWEVLHHAELEHLFKIISKDLGSENWISGLAVFLILILRFSPFYFHQIPIQETSGKLWLDIENGYVVWPLGLVTKLKEINDIDEIVYTPIPAEITNLLQELNRNAINPCTLADLFPIQMDILLKKIRKYLNGMDSSSHKPTIKRIANSFGIYLSNLSHDEGIASIMSHDFRLGTTASLNYFSCKAETFDELLTKTYQHLGFSGKHAASFDMTSRRLVNDDHVSRLLINTLNSAKQSVENLSCEFRLNELNQILDCVTRAVELLLRFSGGGRSRATNGICLHTIDLENGLCLMSDKIISQYHTVRVVPLTSIVIAWLKYYLEMLQLYSDKIAKYNKVLANQISQMLDQAKRRASIPFLFKINSKNKVIPIGTDNQLLILKQNGMAGNVGRHYIDFNLRGSGVGSAVLLALMGRGNVGQEAIGSRSALSPTTILNIGRQSIDAKFANLNLPLPQMVGINIPNTKIFDFPEFTSTNWLRTESFKEKSPYENCPYDEFTLSNSRIYEELNRAWLSSKTKAGIADLMFSLVFRDGICHREELIAMTVETIQKISKINNQYFVDSNCENLGIRRVRLDGITLAIALKIKKSFPMIDKLDLVVSKRIQSLIKNPKLVDGNGIDFLIRLARAFTSLRFPGALRAWSFGEFHGRTTRIEYLARNDMGFCEHPSAIGKKNARTSRKLVEFEDINNLILKSVSKDKNLGSNTKRLTDLLQDLTHIDAEVRSLPACMMHGFARYLCNSVDSPSSVLRYFSPMKYFVDELCIGIDHYDEITDEKWKANVCKYLSNLEVQDRKESPARTALNHLLSYFDIDIDTYKKSDPVKSARTYIDLPSDREIDAAITMLDANTTNNKTINLAGLWFRLAKEFPSRSMEINGIRAIDILPTTPIGIVISKESLGSLKSRNGQRINFIKGPNLGEELLKLREIHFRFDRSGKSYLFCDADNPFSVKNVDEYNDKASHALFCASGSDSLTPRNLRQKFISDEIHELLKPETQQKLHPNQLRTAFFSLADRAGHADPYTTFKNYGCDFDIPRRQWMDHINTNENFQPSEKFIASLNSSSSDNSGQSVHCNIDDTSGRNVKRKKVSNRERLVDLSSLVRNGCTSLPWEMKKELTDHRLNIARYIAFRLAGHDPDQSGFISRVGTEYQSRIESQQGKVFKSNSTQISMHRSVAKLSYVFGEHFRNIVHASYDWRTDSVSEALLESSIVSSTKPLLFPAIHCLHLLSTFNQQLKVVNLELTVTARSRHKYSNQNKTQLRNYARDLGFKVELLNSRYFNRDSTVRIRLLPMDKSKPTWLENQRSMLAIISAILSTIIISKED